MVSTTPSSRATIIDAVLNTDPGSIRSLTALFLISRYSPSLHFVMLTIAFTSPVCTSINMATPTFPLISFNSSRSALSAKSCMLTSIVVTISAPSTGGLSTILRNLFIIFLRLDSPLQPRSILLYESSSPHLAESISPYMSPTVRWASVPNGRLRELNISEWNPPLYAGILSRGSFLTSVYVL